MIDKKVVKEREQAEYINRLERIILELRREGVDPKYRSYTSEEWRKRRSEMLKKNQKFREQVFDWMRDTMVDRPEYDNYKEED